MSLSEIHHFRQIMPFETARQRCAGCQNALTAPLVDLPQANPDPNQDTAIVCRAKTVPKIRSDRPVVLFPEELQRFSVHYAPRVVECEYSPQPDAQTCPVAIAEQRLYVNDQPLGYTFIARQTDIGTTIHVDPMEGPIVIPSRLTNILRNVQLFLQDWIG